MYLDQATRKQNQQVLMESQMMQFSRRYLF